MSNKSAELDAFWSAVEGNKAQYLPQLRTELKNFNHPTFFLYDGSQLLLSIAENRQDTLIALEAIPHGELPDINSTAFLFSIHALATRGFNTSKPAFHILSDEKFSAFVPRHSLRVNKDLALLFMLLPLPEQFYLDSAIVLLNREKREDSQGSLALLIWQSVSEKGDSALAAFSNDSSCFPEVREAIQGLLSMFPSVRLAVLSPEQRADLDELKMIRRHIMRRISDEALYELRENTRSTRKILQKN